MLHYFCILYISFGYSHWEIALTSSKSLSKMYTKMFPCRFKEKLHLKILMHFPFQIRKYGLYKLVVVRYYLFFSCIGYCSCRQLLLSALLLPVYLQSEKSLLRCQVLHQHFCNKWPNFKENTETLIYSTNIALIATTKILTCD